MAWTAPRTWTDGELVTKVIMDAHVRDNFLATREHLVVRKPSDESVTSSAVMQADNDLILPVLANEVWQFEFFLRVTASTAGDIAIRFTFPSGTFSAQWVGGVTGSPDAWQLGASASPTGQRTLQMTSSTLPDIVSVKGVHANGGSGGNVALEWAQAVSDGTATTVKANSTLWAVKLA